MSIINPIHKCIVTAIALTVMFSLPSGAQEVTVDELFDELQLATGEQSDRITDQIETLWSQSGSASMDLLLTRGRDMLQEGDIEAAIEHLTALVDHAPDFAEGYYTRATAFFEAGLFGPALADLRTTLALNPRHFGALAGLAHILEETGEDEKALAAYRKVLELVPHDETVKEAVSRLEGVAL